MCGKIMKVNLDETIKEVDANVDGGMNYEGIAG